MKTKIEWCDYSINPVKGLCPADCKDNQGKPYCYARRMYKRFNWNPEIRFDDSVFRDIDRLDKKQGQRIFVGSTIELFGDWIPEGWMKTILEYCHLYYHTTFIFLTKQPQNLIKWSPFPENCWVGVSVTNREQAHKAFGYFPPVSAKVKFLSFEPLLDDVAQYLYFPNLIKSVQWVIIGQQTPANPKTSPKMLWIQEILVSASNAGNIPVFMKNNLQPLLIGQWAGWELRQEFPK